MSAVLKHLEDLLRFNTTRNMRFNNQVHELRKRDCNVRFHVVLVLKQMVCVFVSGCIASFTNRVPYRLLACVEAKAFNALEKVRPGSSKAIAKAFESNAQQDACRPRRVVKNLLGFAIRLFDGLRHVFRGWYANGLRPHKLPIRQEAVAVAMRALSYAEGGLGDWIREREKANFFEPVKGNYVVNAFVSANGLDNGEKVMFAKGLAMRTGKGQKGEVV